MSLFCFLFIPAFALWRRSLGSEAALASEKPGQITGFLVGVVAALFRFNAGNVFDQRGFGLVFYLQQLVDGPAFDALLPFGAYLLICRFIPPTARPSGAGAVSFSLAALAPLAAARAFSWSNVPDPVQLVVVPILMVSLVLVVPFAVSAAASEYGFRLAAAIAGAISAPLAATLCTWGFLTDRPLAAYPAFFVCAAAALWVIRREAPSTFAGLKRLMRR